MRQLISLEHDGLMYIVRYEDVPLYYSNIKLAVKALNQLSKSIEKIEKLASNQHS